MIHLETPHSFWSEDTWVTYTALFQLTRNNTSEKMTDISWYTKYLIDGEAEVVDLDELVRENERIRVRLSLLTGVNIRKIRWKKRLRNQMRDSSSPSSSPKKKREYRPLTRNLRSNKLNQFLRVPPKLMESAPQSSETVNGFEGRLSGEYDEAQPQPIVKHILRPISLRHVQINEVTSRSSGTAPHSNFEEKPVVRYSREHSREDTNHQEWHRQYSNEPEEEALQSPVAVSDLVSKFESVRRSNAFSYGRTKTYDPYSSLDKKARTRDREESQRRSIRVILHNSPPVDQTDSRIDWSSNQNHSTPLDVYKIPQRISDVSRSDIPLMRMKSEGHSRIYPAKLGGLNTTDQFSRSPSEPKPLKKGYSFDSGFQTTQKPVHRQVTFTNDHLWPSVDEAPKTVNRTLTFTNDHLGPSIEEETTHNHTSVVSKLPLIHVDGTNIRRAHSASKGDDFYRSYSARSSFDTKKPDPTRQKTSTIVEETDPVPLWKSEVEMRKKTKSYVSAHKPEQPMQLGSTPEWKRLLLEKNKQKRNSTENQHDIFSTRMTKPETNVNFTEPAWKQEFDKIRRQVVTHQSNHYAANVFEREIPEWVKLAEQRRKSKPMSENEDD